MEEKKYQKIPVTINSTDEESNSLWATFSTSDIDRHGEEVSQDWEISNFMRNPVVLNSHNYSDTTETVGRVEALTQKEKSLEGKVKFAVKENPKAKVIFDLYKGGFLNAFSVGFIPGEEKNELLELSAVSVPANAMALAKSKGIDVDKLKKQPEDESIETPETKLKTDDTSEEETEEGGNTRRSKRAKDDASGRHRAI